MATEITDVAADQVPWWLVLIEGIALILLGVMLLINTGEATLILMVFVGVYWLIAGIFRIVSIFIDQRMWGWNLLVGLVGVAAGIIVVQYPLWSTEVVLNTVIVILGLMGLAFGIGNIIGGVGTKNWGAALLGVFSVVLGIVLLANVWLFSFSLPYALGIIAIIGGIAAIVSSLQMKQ